MAARRNLDKEWGIRQGPRRSQRLENKKDTPFSYQRPTASLVTDFTPRALFRKVLQTQPIVSPLVPEKPDFPKPVEPVFQFSLRSAPRSSLGIRLSESAPKDAPQATFYKTRKKKKVRLSEFERALNKQLPSNTDPSLLNNTSPTRSLQISFATPPPLHSAGKRGLIRRPKNYRSVNVKAFEGDIDQNLLQIKVSQSHLVDLQAASLLSNATETVSADTELFAQARLSGQVAAGLSILQSEPASTSKYPARRSMLSCNQTFGLGAKSDMNVGEVTQSDQKEIFPPETECTGGTEATLEERAVKARKELQESLQDAGQELIHNNLKETLTPDTGHADGMEAVSQEGIVSPEREQQESLHGNSRMEHLISDTDTARTSIPTHSELPKIHPGSLSSLLRKKTAKHSVKEMVAEIIKELDSSVVPTVVDHGELVANHEEELPHSKGATWISQRTEAETPNRRRSLQHSAQVARSSIMEMVDGTIPKAGCGGKMREISNVDTEDHMEAEMDPEPDISETERDSENDEPTGKTPAFVRARAFQCSPLLSTPHTLKVTASKSPSKQPNRFQRKTVKQVPKQTKSVCRGKREPALPNSLVKKIFGHYARMPMAKDAFKAVERCVSLYFKHLSEDLEAYTNHARRKTIESADLELLMRRQGLITDKMPLNVLIERYLPLEYRKLLIPIATSGNKVVPPKT